MPSESSIEDKARRNLIRLREEKGLSQSEVGRQISAMGFYGYNQMTVSRTEKGERPLRLNELEAYSRLYGVQLTTLWLPENLAVADECKNQLEELEFQIQAASERYLIIQNRLLSALESAITEDGSDMVDRFGTYIATTPLDDAQEGVLRTGSSHQPATFQMHKGETQDPIDRRIEAHYMGHPKDKRSLRHLWEQTYAELSAWGTSQTAGN